MTEYNPVKIKGVELTATATELNALDGITATVSELNLNDGQTATAAEVNLLDADVQIETVTEAGAVSVVKRITNFDSTGGTFAATLAAPDASMVGHLKVITMTVDNGDVTIALTNVEGGSAATTATFDAVGESLTLMGGQNSKWIVIKEFGVTLS